MEKEVKELIRTAKCRATMWSLLAVLMMAIAVTLIVMIAVIPDIADWVKALMGVLIFAVGQGSICFLSLASFENDQIDELEHYLKRMEELNNEITRL